MSILKVESILNSGLIQSTSGTQNETGSGIGLQLCKEFVKINYGLFKIERIEGKGSLF